MGMTRQERAFRSYGWCTKGLHTWIEGQGRCKDCAIEYRRKRYQANPQEQDNRTRQWRKKNPEKAREYARTQGRKWREKNPKRSRAIVRRAAARRRARERQLPTYVISPKDEKRLNRMPCVHAWRGPCSGPMTWEHIIPVTRPFSTHGIGNLTVLCKRHNSSKNNRLEIEVRAGKPAPQGKKEAA